MTEVIFKIKKKMEYRKLEKRLITNNRFNNNIFFIFQSLTEYVNLTGRKPVLNVEGTIWNSEKPINKNCIPNRGIGHSKVDMHLKFICRDVFNLVSLRFAEIEFSNVDIYGYGKIIIN